MGYDMSLVEVSDEQKEAHARLGLTDPGYFRLNIFGMSAYRQYMDQFNMLCAHDLDWEDVTDVDDPLGGEEPGIPVVKLCSNDGWLVRPEECASAVNAYEQFTRAEVQQVVSEDHLNHWDQWIEFIRAGASTAGFRVY